MKKIIITTCCLLGFILSAGAQGYTSQPTSTPSTQYLPVEGDFALGIEATPFFDYLGNMFNGNVGNVAPFANGYKGAIYGKYFLAHDRAIRAKLRLDFYNEGFSASVQNDTEIILNPLNPLATALDAKNVRTFDVDLLVGYEFRRGHGRIQGFWGGEVGLGLASGKTKFDYGNTMTALNQTPTTSDWLGGTTNSTVRPTETSNGSTFKGTVAAFVGVEYFIASQLSIGAEFNLALVLSSSGQGKTTNEMFDASINQVITQSSRSMSPVNPSSQFGLRTTPTGNIFIMFHF